MACQVVLAVLCPQEKYLEQDCSCVCISGILSVGSFHHACFSTLRKKMAKTFEDKIKKVCACKKVNDKWKKELESLNLWEKEADNRLSTEKVCKGVKAFVSLCVEDTHDKMVQIP